MVVDTSTEFGARVERRLREEEVIWLTTVDGSGRPEPSPVWFLWQDGELLIYSQPNKPKLRNIERNPHVALSFNTTSDGGDVVVIAGEGRADPSAPPASAEAAYVEKYRDAIRRIGMTPESFAQSYSIAVRVRPTRLRGY
jgi:PPOX class probable F420-dependent enzyme